LPQLLRRWEKENRGKVIRKIIRKTNQKKTERKMTRAEA
jgi:hypothetical protein